MNFISLVIAPGAAVLLLAAGYLYGVRLGSGARESLRNDNMRLAQDLEELRTRLSQQATEQDKSLRSAIQQLLAPLIQREQLSVGLSQLNEGLTRNRDLTLLLDQIAEAGNFSTVLLSNEEGLPLAANSSAPEFDRLSAISSLLLLMMDRVAGAGLPPLLSVMLHDESNSTTLCRIFRAHDQRLSLTAVSGGARLTPIALDPALAKINAALLAPS
jgi:hypothetical protein